MRLQAKRKTDYSRSVYFPFLKDLQEVMGAKIFRYLLWDI